MARIAISYLPGRTLPKGVTPMQEKDFKSRVTWDGTWVVKEPTFGAKWEIVGALKPKKNFFFSAID